MLKATENVSTVDISVNTAMDFVDGGHRKFGANTLGVTTYGTDFDLKFNNDNTTVASATISLTVKTRMAKWARGSKTPDKANMDAINLVGKMIVSHEKAHRDSYKDAFNNSKVDEAVVGKTEAAAKKIINGISDILDKACEDLHKSEGKITVTQSGASFSVKNGPAGSGGCKP